MTALQLHDFYDDRGTVREAVRLDSVRCVFDAKKLEHKLRSARCRIVVVHKLVLDEAIGDLTVWSRFGYPLVIVPGQEFSVISTVAVEFEGEKLSPEQCLEWFEKASESKLRYLRCNSPIGMQSCNLPLGHSGGHEHVHCCLICGCSPCVCNAEEEVRR